MTVMKKINMLNQLQTFSQTTKTYIQKNKKTQSLSNFDIIDDYLRSPVINIKDNPIKFWNTYCDRNLAEIAQKFIATSVP